MVEQEDRDLFVREAAGVDAAVGASSGLVPVGLPCFDPYRLRFAAVPVFEPQELASEHHGDPMVRVQVPGRGLSGLEDQAAHKGRAPTVDDFLAHGSKLSRQGSGSVLTGHRRQRLLRPPGQAPAALVHLPVVRAAENRTRLRALVSPPSAQCLRWCPSVQAPGRSQLGDRQPPSRAASARRREAGITRLARPTASGSELRRSRSG